MLGAITGVDGSGGFEVVVVAEGGAVAALRCLRSGGRGGAREGGGRRGGGCRG